MEVDLGKLIFVDDLLVWALECHATLRDLPVECALGGEKPARLADQLAPALDGAAISALVFGRQQELPGLCLARRQLDVEAQLGSRALRITAKDDLVRRR